MQVDFTPPQYVTFERMTGDIISVGPSFEDGTDYIEVKFDQVEPILSFKENKDVYKVVYDTKVKNFKLVNRKEETVVYDSIHKFRELNEDYDIKATVKYNKNIIVFNLNPQLLEKLKDKTLLDQDFSFSITKKDNPHYLLDLIKVNFTKPKQFRFTFRPNEYSIYTKGSFAKYVIEEIK